MARARLREYSRRFKAWQVRAICGLGSKNVQCNVCGWQGRRFASDAWHPQVKCPNCRAAVRHRLLAAALSHSEPLSASKIIANKRILHFAVEPGFKDLFATQAGHYIMIDYPAPPYQYETDLYADMAHLPLSTASVDCIIACDVLEHVPRHLNALNELARILRAGGYAILTVPQQDNLTRTLEDPNTVTPEQRQELYGQWDHLRMYGADFTNMLLAARFAVTIITEVDFPPELVAHHVLFPPVLSPDPRADNHRKVYFAQKIE